jgi:hypothetical protein
MNKPSPVHHCVGYAEIELANGTRVKIDNEDVAFARLHRWYLNAYGYIVVSRGFQKPEPLFSPPHLAGRARVYG